MRKLRTRRGGFTLIELMIVVAIIGILAAIAIPNFLKFQLRSKTGEAKTNLAAIRTAEESYFAEYGVFIAAADYPTGPSPAKQEWIPGATNGFDTMGWSPEGEVFYSYAVALGGAQNTAYSVGAYGDLDGGGDDSDFGYIHPDPAAVAVAPGNNTCGNTGVWNASSNAADLLNTVGQCDRLDGQDEF
jgi:type IV pilus assembly protein PilA